VNAEYPAPENRKCPFCGVEFTRLHNLQSHLHTHTRSTSHEPLRQCFGMLLLWLELARQKLRFSANNHRINLANISIHVTPQENIRNSMSLLLRAFFNIWPWLQTRLQVEFICMEWGVYIWLRIGVTLSHHVNHTGVGHTSETIRGMTLLLRSGNCEAEKELAGVYNSNMTYLDSKL